jgi:hypothetical protein
MTPEMAVGNFSCAAWFQITTFTQLLNYKIPRLALPEPAGNPGIR